MRFGNDFNPSVPTDGDFVRSLTRPNMAQEMRDFRTRLILFFGSRVTVASLDFQQTTSTQTVPVVF